MSQTYVTTTITNYPPYCPSCNAEIAPGDIYFAIPAEPPGMICESCSFVNKPKPRIFCEDCMMGYELTA